MTILWAILGILSAFALVFLISKKIRPWWTKIGGLLISLLLLFYSLFQFLIPVYSLVEPTGKFEVAQSVDYFNYKPADKSFETSKGTREIPVKIWHPNEIEDINGQLILFSHGSFGVMDSNDSLFHELASHGYVVASLAHPYHSFTSPMSDGSNLMVDRKYFQEVFNAQADEDLEKTAETLQGWSQIHEDDLTAVIGSIQEGESDDSFLDASDSDEVTLMGHSLGGTAALSLGRSREDVQAVIALESPFGDDITEVTAEGYEFISEPYPVPMLNIYSDATWPVLDEWVLYEQNWNYLQSTDQIYQHVHIEGSGHLGLTDLSRATPILTNLMDGGLNTKGYEEVLEEINREILDFLTHQSIK